MRIVTENSELDKPILEAGSQKLAFTFPDELLINAMGQMLEKDLGRLMVVDWEDPLKLVGYLGRQEVLITWKRGLEDERGPEGGWLAKQVYAIIPLKSIAKITRMVGGKDGNGSG
jgi:hypothetical protein